MDITCVDREGRILGGGDEGYGVSLWMILSYLTQTPPTVLSH